MVILIKSNISFFLFFIREKLNFNLKLDPLVLVAILSKYGFGQTRFSDFNFKSKLDVGIFKFGQKPAYIKQNQNWLYFDLLITILD